MSPTAEVSPPRSTWLARREARCRLLAAGPVVVALSLLHDWPPVVAAAGLALLLALVERPRLRWRGAAAALVPVAALLPWTVRRGEEFWAWGPVVLTEGGLLFAGVFLLKTFSLLLIVAALAAAAPLAAHALAARRLGAPSLFVHLFTLAWRYAHLFREEWRRTRTALRARGFRGRMGRHGRQTVGQAVGSLLVRGHERAERVGQAMRCRGFDGQFRAMGAVRVTAADVALVLGGAAVAGGLLAWDVAR